MNPSTTCRGSRHRRWMPALLACLLPACQAARTSLRGGDPQAPGGGLPPAEVGELLDGFEGEGQTVWSFDSADDEGDAGYGSDGATQGRQALQVRLRGKGRTGKLLLRREVSWDLGQAAALRLDVTAPAAGASLAVAFKTRPDDAYQESRALELKPGLNRALRFPLVAPEWKSAASGWAYSGGPVNPERIHRVMLALYPGPLEAGGFRIDNLRVEGEARATLGDWRPRITALTAPRTGEQHTPLEWLLSFQASYRDLFDENDIAVGMRVRAPSGRELLLRGFFWDLLPGGPGAQELSAPQPPVWGPRAPALPGLPGAESGAGAAAAPGGLLPAGPGTVAERRPAWAIRFTPQEVGQYRCQVWVRNRVGETRLAEESLVVVPQRSEGVLPGLEGGLIGVSRRDPTRLERQDGAPFLVLGQNVAWASDWDSYLREIAAYGGNTVRIWLCPWGLRLERRAEAGAYDLAAAARLDALVRLAEKTGVRIILCFTFHGETASFWHESAYARENGGPCLRPEEFFTDSRARRQFQRLLRYASARWGASPALLAWELINEADLARADRVEDLEAWIGEMARALKTADAQRHLVTVSCHQGSSLPELWKNPDLDLISAHGYGPRVSEVLEAQLRPLWPLGKPFLLAEFGGHWEPRVDAEDVKGRRLQAALWLTACGPGAGAALPWWWDTQIRAQGLYGRFRAVGRFLAGEDRRGRFREWVSRSLERDPGVQVQGVLDERGARLYLFKPAWMEQLESRKGNLTPENASLVLTGLLDGRYRAECWDAEQGTVFKTLESVADDSVLRLSLPVHPGEFALKIERLEGLPLGLGDRKGP